MKHVVGPLKFRGAVEGNRLLICDENDSPIAAVYMTNDPDVAHVRARTLCAAPALLEACEAAQQDIEAMEGTPMDFTICLRLNGTLGKLKSAIRLAKGMTVQEGE